MENSLIHFFEIYSIFLIVYGVKLKIWRASRTTKYVIIFFAFAVGLEEIQQSLEFDYCMEARLILTSIFMLFLFIRAVMKKDSYKQAGT